MAGSLFDDLKELATVDLFDESRKGDAFVGRPFYLDFDELRLMSNDKWKHDVNGVPAGAFLLAVYGGEPGVDEALLLRVLGPTKLPTDDDVVMAMVDHYKEAPTAEGASRLDSYTRSEFQFSGLKCRVIGTFYKDNGGGVRFAGDLDNFYAPHNYRVVKPTGRALEYIVNFREDGLPGGVGDERIGKVRYSSSLRHVAGEDIPVYVSALDFLGKRTALFGMTRTGKSNSVKKIIQATHKLSRSGVTVRDRPIKPVGQIVFDINGEYANANRQDEGTAIFQQYPSDVHRYSVDEKEGFNVMKLNFYRSIEDGFGLIRSLLADDTSDYVKAFLNIDWEAPDSSDHSATTRYKRRVAAYKACLYQAGFPAGRETVSFESSKDIRESGIPGLTGIEPKGGISLDEAASWFAAAWENYADASGPFQRYKQQKGKEWADEDLQTLMRVLTRRAQPTRPPTESGFRKLIRARSLHTARAGGRSFEDDIVDLLRDGKVVLIDLSQGDPDIQRTYSDRVCRKVFADGMSRFVKNDEDANFIQMYFEEAHNLFPRKDERDLTLIYNRIAKEGQKLGLGLCYATQEVSSISSSILKNTQNWFVSHLNNREELRELDKYYDFEDFSSSLRRTTDRGFIRLKTDSNTFIVPIQVDQFYVEEAS